MQKVAVLSPRQAADLIADDDVVTVSSSSALGCPDAVLRGIGERFAETSAPRNLTTVHPIAAGDMYGVKGIDHLAHPGLLGRVIVGSLPSGPSGATPPAIWRMVEREEVAAYNFPSGVLFQMHRAAAAHQPGVLTPVGLRTFVDPRLQGGRMNAATPADLVEVTEVADEQYLFFRALAPQVAVVRATTADEYGNLTFEDEGSPLGALDQAYAAKNNGGIVIAQVKRLAQGRTLPAQSVRVPGILVDAVVLAPEQTQTTATVFDPAIAGQVRRPVDSLPPLPFSVEKVVARRGALELSRGETVNLGFGVSALVPHVLVEEGEGTAVSWVLEQGAVGGVPLLDFAFGCAQSPDAIMQSADQFTLLQGGGFGHSLLSFLEIGPSGDVNVHHLPGRRHVTAGVGGFADITTGAPAIVFLGSFTAGRRRITVTEDGALDIVEDGPHTKLVRQVAGVTFSGALSRERGQRVLYITERCVLELRDEGLTVIELAPGVDIERHVLARSEVPLRVADDLTEMDRRLFLPGPVGLDLPELPRHGRLRAVLAR
ncbi:acyl CoA:acetate/3-ketoacid CoA transferase [Georgenia thermotolerans]|uniref:Acyl CoA:acetate/3-ketoacid CoA transferase n=1 Tax=Georgenia thermotolerans TaxID=527326 RepID=A0A7J5URH1_9MICO|nr:malonate decarboxylase subunit alpha [Georgenia thermotolerans]KAE8764811.1 acyl CoA:acetate/3-ketoacid CoA transferase [Georgenia thermotolerans]